VHSAGRPADGVASAQNVSFLRLVSSTLDLAAGLQLVRKHNAEIATCRQEDLRKVRV
jgi:hypothetical protein